MRGKLRAGLKRERERRRRKGNGRKGEVKIKLLPECVQTLLSSVSDIT